MNPNSFEDLNTIQRCPHDEENPYAQISRALIRDESISFSCRALIIYLLSNRSGWKISIAQVANHVKQHMGRDAVYALFDEAIEAGYIKKEEIQRKMPKGGSLKGFVYYVSETPKFKKFYRHPENQDAGDQDPDFTSIKKEYKKERIYKENNNTPISPLPESDAVASAAKAAEVCVDIPPKKRIKEPPIFSTQVLEIGGLMLAILTKHNSMYRPPDNLDKFYHAVELIIEKDKQNPNEVLELFEWACSDLEKRGDFNGWQPIICKNKIGRKDTNPAEIFRTHVASINGAKKSQPKRKFAPCSNDDDAYKALKGMTTI